VTKLVKRTGETLLGTFKNENGELIFETLPSQGVYQKSFAKIPGGYNLWDVITCRFTPDGRINLMQKFANSDDFDKEEKILFSMAHVRTFFPESVEKEAQELQFVLSPKRKDFRDWHTLTIDGSDAKDLDDALSIRTLSNGHVLLWVHIADVSEYVREGTLLDREARDRATSIYTPWKVIPMLPERLSNDLSSLHPGAPKLTLSVLMEVDSTGNVRRTEVTEGVIDSKKKWIYESIQKSYDTKEYDSENEKNTIESLYTLYDILIKRRKKEGKILFESTETYFEFDKSAPKTDVLVPENVKKRKRMDSHMLIEECMILANEEIAKWCSHRNIPFLSRVHGVPGNDQMRTIEYVIGKVGTNDIFAKKPAIEPIHIRNFMDKLHEDDVYRYSRLLLPKMAKANYSDKKFRHFGLALEYYAHFTSPIRRYPDLQIHRIIKEELQGTLTPERKKHYAEVLKKIARHCSDKERQAEDIERQFDALYACRYMSSFVGSNFDAMISGIAAFAYFVELSNGIECMIELPHRWNKVDELTGSLLDKNGKVILQIGQKVKVTIERIDMKEKRIVAIHTGASFWQL
jgi:ribonuclease R